MMVVRKYNSEFQLVDQFTVPKPWFLATALAVALKDAEKDGFVNLSCFSIYFDFVLFVNHGKGNYFTSNEDWRWFEDSLVEELHKRHYTTLL